MPNKPFRYLNFFSMHTARSMCVFPYLRQCRADTKRSLLDRMDAQRSRDQGRNSRIAERSMGTKTPTFITGLFTETKILQRSQWGQISFPLIWERWLRKFEFIKGTDTSHTLERQSYQPLFKAGISTPINQIFKGGRNKACNKIFQPPLSSSSTSGHSYNHSKPT